MIKMRYFSKTILILTILIFICCSVIYASDDLPQTTSEKVVYLTFDDGPTPKITEAILDILKAQDVKATFFVVGKEIKGRETILTRIYEEGHTIGLHTYSHDFKTIYRNPQAFIMEMQKTEATINETLGTQLSLPIIRFPGGSAGRLNTSFYNKLSEKGYLIFDWNIDLKDGIKSNLSPRQFLDNSKKCMDKSTRRIILAHCNSNNHNTCMALDDIIAYYKGEGYVFKAIEPTTQPYFYHFKN